MLVLSRNENQSIVINDNIYIHVQKIEGGRVILGVQAPRHIPVDRLEKRRSSETEGTEVETQEEVSMAADMEQDCNA